MEEILCRRQKIGKNVCQSWEDCSRLCKHAQNFVDPPRISLFFGQGLCPELRYGAFWLARLRLPETPLRSMFVRKTGKGGSESVVAERSVVLGGGGGRRG